MAARAPWRESFGVSAGWDAEAVVRDRNARAGLVAMKDTARSTSRPGRLLHQLPQCSSTPAGEEMQAQICRDLLSFMTKRNPVDADRCRHMVHDLRSSGELVKLLASSNSSVIEAAARCLQALCFGHTDAVRYVVSAGAAEHLAAILGRPWALPSRGGVVETSWWRVQLAASELLQNLAATDLDSVAQIIETRVATSLARLVVEPADGGTQLRLAACGALTNLTWAPTARQGALLEEAASWDDFVPQILAMLDPKISNAEEEQEAAAALLWSLLRGNDSFSRGMVEKQLVERGYTKRCISIMTGASSDRLRVCCSAILAIIGLDMPNTTMTGSVVASGSWQSRRGGPTRCTLPSFGSSSTADGRRSLTQRQEEDHLQGSLAQAWSSAGVPNTQGRLETLHPLGKQLVGHSSPHARPF